MSDDPSPLARLCLTPPENPRPTKKNYQGLFNLSSNELKHPLLNSLWQKFQQEHATGSAAGYPYWPALVTAIAEDNHLDENQVWIAAGSDSAIHRFCHLLAGQHWTLVLESPAYVTYGKAAQALAVPVIEVPLQNDHPLQTYEKILETAGHYVVVLTNPNGFSGAVYAPDFLQSLLALCQKGGHLLVIDEAYCAFSACDHRGLLTQYPGVVLLRSYSKSLGMASLRLAAVFGAPAFITAFSQSGCANEVSGSAIAYYLYARHHKVTYRRIYDDINRGKKLCQAQLATLFPQWQTFPGQANFLLIATTSPAEAKAFSDWLLLSRVQVRLLVNIDDMRHCLRITINGYYERLLVLFENYAATSRTMRRVQ